jgi:hypothetical protein
VGYELSAISGERSAIKSIFRDFGCMALLQPVRKIAGKIGSLEYTSGLLVFPATFGEEG